MESPESLPPDARLRGQAGEKPTAEVPAGHVMALQAPTTAAELIPVLFPLDSLPSGSRWLIRLRFGRGKASRANRGRFRK